MLIYEENLQKKIGTISQLGAEKITFPLNVVERQTDICFYRVALHYPPGSITLPNALGCVKNYHPSDKQLLDCMTYKFKSPRYEW